MKTSMAGRGGEHRAWWTSRRSSTQPRPCRLPPRFARVPLTPTVELKFVTKQMVGGDSGCACERRPSGAAGRTWPWSLSSSSSFRSLRRMMDKAKTNNRTRTSSTSALYARTRIVLCVVCVVCRVCRVSCVVCVVCVVCRVCRVCRVSCVSCVSCVRPKTHTRRTQLLSGA